MVKEVGVQLVPSIFDKNNYIAKCGGELGSNPGHSYMLERDVTRRKWPGRE